MVAVRKPPRCQLSQQGWQLRPAPPLACWMVGQAPPPPPRPHWRGCSAAEEPEAKCRPQTCWLSAHRPGPRASDASVSDHEAGGGGAGEPPCARRRVHSKCSLARAGSSLTTRLLRARACVHLFVLPNPGLMVDTEEAWLTGPLGWSAQLALTTEPRAPASSTLMALPQH